MSKNPAEIHESRCFSLLSNARRRQVLRILMKSGGSLSVKELAEAICSDIDGEVSPKDIRGIHVSLHHAHLPKFDDADVIAYDFDERTIRLGPNFDTLFKYIDYVDDEGTHWSGT